MTTEDDENGLKDVVPVGFADAGQVEAVLEARLESWT